MPMKNQKKKKDLEKLRKILDNPCEESNEEVLSDSDSTLRSIQHRLSQESSSYVQSDSLDPKVTIHSKTKKDPVVPKATLQEEKPLHTPTKSQELYKPAIEVKSGHYDPCIQPNELLEIHLPEKQIPAFKELEKDKPQQKEASTFEEETLPSWDLVDEQKPPEKEQELPKEPVQTWDVVKEKSKEQQKEQEKPQPSLPAKEPQPALSQQEEPIYLPDKLPKETPKDTQKHKEETKHSLDEESIPTEKAEKEETKPEDIPVFTEIPKEDTKPIKTEKPKEQVIPPKPEPEKEKQHLFTQVPPTKTQHDKPVQPTEPRKKHGFFKNPMTQQTKTPLTQTPQQKTPEQKQQISPVKKEPKPDKTPAKKQQVEKKKKPKTPIFSRQKPSKPSKKVQPKSQPKKKTIPIPTPKQTTQPSSSAKLPNPFFILKTMSDEHAQLLLKHQVSTLEQLQKASIDDLTRVGIDKKTAKKIRKEVKQVTKKPKPKKAQKKLQPPKIDKSKKYSFLGSKPKKEKPKKPVPPKQIPKQPPAPPVSKTPEPKSVYSYQGYTLYKKEIETEPGKTRTIHFFSKSKPDQGEPVPLPREYEVNVNAKTGLPYLIKKK